MNVLDDIKAALDNLASHASSQVPNQNLSDILKSAAAKVAQASAHVDAAIFEPLNSKLSEFLKAADKLAGDPASKPIPDVSTQIGSNAG
jgi:hypothetical protein